MAKDLELICKALEIIRQALINIRHGREDHNTELILELNECIIDIETIEEVNHGRSHTSRSTEHQG